MARQCCICQYPWSILVHLHLQGYVESVVYPWWNETTGTWVWTLWSQNTHVYPLREGQPPALLQMWSSQEQDILFSRLSSFTSSGISQGEFQILFKNWVDGLRWWIDCQSNPMMQLQFELRLLLFLLEEHVYSGDLWCLVMAHQIEVMQEERLHKIQPQNCSTPACFAEDREFLEDKKDRAQMELSLYSQAIAVSQLQLGSRYGHPVSMGDRSFPANFSRVDSASLHQTELAHAKCREWLSSVTIGVCVAGDAGVTYNGSLPIQVEVELLSDTIQYLIESDTSEYTLLDSQEFTLVDTGQYALWEVLSHVVAHLLTSMNAY
ncbi:hypothetical protein F4604DRAFT_1688891 [Suillus subluteus]|nr:hypothetical protein F4604DRAFT_1688891 [Suillus subluteus]